MIAIHTRSGSFAPGWVAYCKEHGIAYKEVDCFSSSIISDLRGCRALLWHWEHHDYRAALFARQLIASVEHMGILVFPDTATSWHYDDKIGQKYLLEAHNAPLVPSYVFYDKNVALDWIKTATFPKVWKLRGGAGSQNVRLVGSPEEARRLVRRSFGRGWSNSRLHALHDRIWHFRRRKTLTSFFDIWRGVARTILPHENNALGPVQRHYAYFQDFIPDNDHDIRVVVLGNRAFAIKRMVRAGDFRASGSGFIKHDPAQIPETCIAEAFRLARLLRLQSAAFDFVRSGTEHYGIVEVSYAFALLGYTDCPGFWDEELQWHEEPVRPERFMIEDLLASMNFRTQG